MFKTSTPLFLHAETSVHLGSGQSHGAVDLAVQRERYTGFPVGAASGVKGAVRDWFRHQDDDADRQWAVFGPDTENADAHAGAVAFTDARLLLFPVRAMTGVFAWTTCPTILHRFRRDLESAGHSASWTVPDEADGPLDEETVLGTETSANVANNQVLLEDSAFAFRSHDTVTGLARWLSEHALPETDAYNYWHKSVHARLLVLPDNAFRHFVRHATEVQARVKLNEKGTTGEDGNLFYQENLPSDTLLYALTLAQDDLSGQLEDGGADTLLDYVRRLDGQRLQIGGDASVGRGLTRVHFPDASTKSPPSS
jgi:CRISPR-associated protein Cmr4